MFNKAYNKSVWLIYLTIHQHQQIADGIKFSVAVFRFKNKTALFAMLTWEVEIYLAKA